MMRAMILVAAALFGAAPVRAEPSPCEVATGLGTHACTFPDGQVVVDTDLLDRTVDHAGGLRTDSALLGDTVVHVGVSRDLEAQVGWTAYDREHTRLAAGAELRSSGSGDVTVGGKLALVNAADHPFGLSIQPTLSIPTGGLELGAHGLGGSVLLAFSHDVGEALTIEVTPQGDLVGDRADNGRHWEYGATVGLDWTLTKLLTTTVEYRRFREEDPAFRRTSNVGALSLGILPTRKLQLNVGAAVGIDRNSPKLQITAGFALHLF